MSNKSNFDNSFKRNSFNDTNMVSLDYNQPFNKIVIDMANLYQKKNQDYGNAFGNLFDEYGLTYAIMHLHEKLNRIKAVHKNNNANNESIKDSLIDLANYAVMTLVELNKSSDTILNVYEPIIKPYKEYNDPIDNNLKSYSKKIDKEFKDL